MSGVLNEQKVTRKYKLPRPYLNNTTLQTYTATTFCPRSYSSEATHPHF